MRSLLRMEPKSNIETGKSNRKTISVMAVKKKVIQTIPKGGFEGVVTLCAF